MPKRIAKPSTAVFKLHRISSTKAVRLLRHESKQGVVVWAVEYPAKISGEDTGIPVEQQYLTLNEAETFFAQMVGYYRSRKETDNA